MRTVSNMLGKYKNGECDFIKLPQVMGHIFSILKNPIYFNFNGSEIGKHLSIDVKI